MLPYLGCAQATHQTAPSWLQDVSSRTPHPPGLVKEGLPLERLYQTLRLALDLEDLDCAVAGAGC